MSETPAEQPQAATVTPTETTAPAETTPAQETDWKAEARKWETRAKENAGAAKRLAEFEDAQKTEIQKANERAEFAEQQLQAQRAEALRLTVAAKHGITGDYLDLLVGADEAELEAKAVKVASLISPKSAPGALGPYVPPEGSAPGAAVSGDRHSQFAAFLKQQG